MRNKPRVTRGIQKQRNLGGKLIWMKMPNTQLCTWWEQRSLFKKKIEAKQISNNV